MRLSINGYLVTVRLGKRYFKFKVLSPSEEGAVRTVHRRIPLTPGIAEDYWRGLQGRSLDWEVTETVEFDLSKHEKDWDSLPTRSGHEDFDEWDPNLKKWVAHVKDQPKE